MIKAVVFDMDGVLIDAKDWHYEALNRALALFGFNISRYEHLTTFDGLPTGKKLEMLSVSNGFPRKLHTFVNQLKQLYTTEIVHLKCRPNFIHEYALSKLKADGYKLGVASNSIRPTVELMMQYADLVPYLNTMLSNQDIKHPKPSPEIYQKAMEILEVDPSECLIVEDNEHGIKAARASGAHLLAVEDISEVNYANIMAAIALAEGKK